MSLGNTSVANTDLSNTVWVFNDDISVDWFREYISSEGSKNYNLVFEVHTSNGGVDVYSGLTFGYDYFGNGGGQILYFTSSSFVTAYDSMEILDSTHWISGQDYRSITITGGLDIYNHELFVFLNQVATQEKPNFAVFDTLFEIFNDALFGGSVSIDDNSMQSLIVLLLAAFFSIAFIVAPFVVVFWILRSIGRLLNAV